MKCKKHPTYKVKREPRSDCNHCWVMWLDKNILSLSFAIRHLEAVAKGFP